MLSRLHAVSITGTPYPHTRVYPPFQLRAHSVFSMELAVSFCKHASCVMRVVNKLMQVRSARRILARKLIPEVNDPKRTRAAFGTKTPSLITKGQVNISEWAVGAFEKLKKDAWRQLHWSSLMVPHHSRLWCHSSCGRVHSLLNVISYLTLYSTGFV